MPRFMFKGGPQQPDLHGYLEPGDVLDLPEEPDVGEWETSSAPATGPSPTPQPTPDLEQGQPAGEPAEED